MSTADDKHMRDAYIEWATGDGENTALDAELEYDIWLAKRDDSIRASRPSYGDIFVAWALDFIGERYPGADLPRQATITTRESADIEREHADAEWVATYYVELSIAGTNYSRTYEGSAGSMLREVAEWDRSNVTQ